MWNTFVAWVKKLSIAWRFEKLHSFLLQANQDDVMLVTSFMANRTASPLKTWSGSSSTSSFCSLRKRNFNEWDFPAVFGHYSISIVHGLIVIRITLSLSIIRQNQEGGDTAQITDFAQTCYKCWIWWFNDYSNRSGQNILFPLSRGWPFDSYKCISN